MPGDPSVRYANVAGQDLYRSEKAQDWRLVTGATAGAMQIAVGPDSAPQLYALTMDAGLIVSDGGTTWQRMSLAPQAAATSTWRVRLDHVGTARRCAAGGGPSAESVNFSPWARAARFTGHRMVARLDPVTRKQIQCEFRALASMLTTGRRECPGRGRCVQPW